MSRIADVTRIGAILSGDHETRTIYFLGYGVYDGDRDPLDPANAPLPVGGVAEIYPDLEKIARENGIEYHPHLNPRLKLDNGEVAWGCECWWGDEDAVKAQLEKYKAAGYTIVETSMAKSRDEYRQKKEVKHADS